MPRRNKYNAKKTLFNDVLYDSKAEAAFASQLELLKKAKGDLKVIEIERQVPYQVELSGKKICKYIADFRVLFADGRTIVYDVKGVKTDVYRLKKKLVEAQFGITITEVTKWVKK